jgi:phosphoribosylaminoimidazole (AIR) synthetase
MIGSVGVAMLLTAYFMNLFKLVKQESRVYGILNVTGAGLACYASFMIPFIPFVILEGMWAIVALVGMLQRKDHR